MAFQSTYSLGNFPPLCGRAFVYIRGWGNRLSTPNPCCRRQWFHLLALQLKESGNNSMALENDINLQLILIKVGLCFNVKFHFLYKHLSLLPVSVMYKSKSYGSLSLLNSKICKEAMESDGWDKCFVIYQ